jgi:hypothetical protein
MFCLKITETKPKKEVFFVILPHEKMDNFRVPFALKERQEI